MHGVPLSYYVAPFSREIGKAENDNFEDFSHLDKLRCLTCSAVCFDTYEITLKGYSCSFCGKYNRIGNSQILEEARYLNSSKGTS